MPSQRAIEFEIDRRHMLRALELATRGRGFVEPNPMVGCVIARGETVLAEGWHQRFGGSHAEVAALESCPEDLGGATMYVTLEPCCHQGKTPPCTDAIRKTALRRVVVAERDPFPAVDGGGVRRLAAAGFQVEVGLCGDIAARLTAPYRKLLTRKRPWVIAKWAMTLDGKIAARTGKSQWISGEESRAIVHELRGLVDGVLVGRKTADRDDPLLTARPPGPRVATRIVVDTQARLSLNSQLVRTAKETPTLVATAADADIARVDALIARGVEVFRARGATPCERLSSLLDELGRRRLTNVLVEGGGAVLGELFDAGEIDEFHVFLAPKLVGGERAVGPIAGWGLPAIPSSANVVWEPPRALGSDLYLCGRVVREANPTRDAFGPP